MIDIAEQMPVQQPQNNENAIPSTKEDTVEAIKRVSLFYKVVIKKSDFNITFSSLIFEKKISDSTHASQSS